MSEYQVLERLVPYVPPYWVRQAFRNPDTTLVGREERPYGAVLFVDISGFTTISEALSRMGHDGVEELSKILERYFTVMSKLVLWYGGDVVKFAGDSLIVMFPASEETGEAHLGSALRCSLDMQTAMDEFAEVATSAGTYPLRMKTGIGEGRLYHTTIGDERHGMQPVFAGLPLARCMEAEQNATAGEIVADAGLLSRVPGRVDFGEVRGIFRLIAAVEDAPVLDPVQDEWSADLYASKAELVARRLVAYLPRQLVDRVRQGSTGVYGEYRRVTIMFVKFGGLNYDWDPDVGSVLQTYFVTMRDCITRQGGRLNEVDIVSDGGTLVVFFGAPIANEDDEMRAVSCAWEMQQAVADVRLATGGAADGLRQCVGISSGSVFVGDVGAPVRRTYTTVGDEVNLASRLMNLAKWGEVLVTGWMEDRTSGQFDYEPMGETRIKGKTDLVSLHVLVGPRQDGIQDVSLSQLMDRQPLIGREQELADLHAIAQEARNRDPQVVLVTGDAGIGKSRLIGELLQRWAEWGGRAYVGDCRTQGAHKDYAPWRSLLNAVFGIQDSDLPERRIEKLETLLTFMSPSLSEHADVFRKILNLGVSESVPVQSLSSQKDQDELRSVLTRFVRVLAERQPLFLIFENAHEIDDLSWALVHGLMEQVQGFPLLVGVAGRPGRSLTLSEGAVSIFRLNLSELSQEDSLSLAERLLSDMGLGRDLASLLFEQTQGNPFYMEEMVRFVTRATAQGQGDPRKILDRGVSVPEAITDTVQTQFDQLDEDAKLTLRVAAVIGTRFSARVLRLAHPVDVSPHELSLRVASLERARFVSLEQFGQDMWYRFRYPVACRVIYAGLLGIDRERLHLRVAEAIERVYVDQLDEHYVRLYEHFRQANVRHRAGTYAILAGKAAHSVGEIDRALLFYGQAEEMLSACETCAARCRDGLLLELLSRRAELNYARVDVGRASEDWWRASEISRRLGDSTGIGESLLGLGRIALDQARYTDAVVLLRRAMQPFSVFGCRERAADILLLLSRIHGLQGQFAEATRLVESALASEESRQREGFLAACRVWQGEMDLWTGRYRIAGEMLQRAERHGKRSDTLAAVAQSQSGLAEVFLRRGRWGLAVSKAQEALQTSLSVASPVIVARAQQVLALVCARIGSYQEADEWIQQTLLALGDSDWRVALASTYWIGGQVRLGLQRLDEAEDWLGHALALGRESNTVRSVVRGLLGLGGVAGARGDWPEAQRLYSETKARARVAGLEYAVLEARLGLADACAARQDWRRSQLEALQAVDSATRLQCPYEELVACTILVRALSALHQSTRAARYLNDARRLAAQLSQSLSEPLRQAFLDQPWIRTLGYSSSSRAA